MKDITDMNYWKFQWLLNYTQRQASGWRPGLKESDQDMIAKRKAQRNKK